MNSGSPVFREITILILVLQAEVARLARVSWLAVASMPLLTGRADKGLRLRVKGLGCRS